MSHGRYSADSSASELIGAVHASMPEEDSAAEEPLSTRCAAFFQLSCISAKIYRTGSCGEKTNEIETHGAGQLSKCPEL